MVLTSDAFCRQLCELTEPGCLLQLLYGLLYRHKAGWKHQQWASLEAHKASSCRFAAQQCRAAGALHLQEQQYMETYLKLESLLSLCKT